MTPGLQTFNLEGGACKPWPPIGLLLFRFVFKNIVFICRRKTQVRELESEKAGVSHQEIFALFRHFLFAGYKELLTTVYLM